MARKSRKKAEVVELELPCTCTGLLGPSAHCEAHGKAKRDDGEMDEEQAGIAVQAMAACITSEREFIAVLQDTKPELRESVYQMLKPHVGYAGVRPFALMPFDFDA